MKTKKVIVITSIFPPTEGVEKFAEMDSCSVIIIGDYKTPSNWEYRDVNYYSTERQKGLDFKILNSLPYNHYCRKMIGYLVAAKNGAEFIIDTDDDNIPKEEWGFPSFHGDFKTVDSELGFVNIYQLYTDRKIWPRGLPLNLIKTDFELEKKMTAKKNKIGVWQGLADEDPDVDAIYRLTDDKPCYFASIEPIALGIGTVSPFNSQNTIICKELFALLYLPAFVTFRFTDILRGLVAQPIMWLYGYTLGFTNATVVQKRNPHDYFKDFVSEIPMYINAEEIINIVSDEINKTLSIYENLYNAYNALFKKGIVDSRELILLSAWLEDIKHL